jgi:hypothetical protein
MPSNIRNTSFAKLSSEIKNIYAEIINDFSKLNQSVREPLELLQRVIDEGDNKLDSFTNTERSGTLNFFLDSFGLVSASSGSQLKLGNLDSFGGKRQLIRELTGTKNSQTDDWLFAMLIQGYLRLNGFPEAKDLKFNPEFSKEGSQVCDFLLDHGQVAELIECTRIHPHPRTEVTRDGFVQKLASKISKKKIQLDNTSKDLDGEVIRHLYIDVSGYGTLSRNYRKVSKVSKIGFNQADLEELVDDFPESIFNDIEAITFCWNNLYQTDEYGPIGHSANSCTVPSNYKGMEYAGWSIMGYPKSKESIPFREMRISTTARSIEWISTTFNNLSDSGSFWTCEEVL